MLSGEVVRIEKTLEFTEDGTEDEDEPTLSHSMPASKSQDTKCTYQTPPQSFQIKQTPPQNLQIIQTQIKGEIKRKRSFSETAKQEHERSSRRLGRAGSARNQNAFEVTQSVDRAPRDRSPVFFLEPDDWIRTEGSSPLPPCRGSSLTHLAFPPSNLSALSGPEDYVSDPARSYLRSQSVTPSSSRLPSVRSRSMTPAPREEERQRKVAIPILCRRSAMMVGIEITFLIGIFKSNFFVRIYY